MRKCTNCKNYNVVGRSDKKFCSVSCKNVYHQKLRNYSSNVTRKINTILHRNHGILSEVLSSKKNKIKVKRMLLVNKKFQFDYHTHHITNSQGKTYHYLYNTAWMSFSNDEVLIIRV